MRAFVFPGQGSQAVGMGKDLADTFPEARAVFDAVDAALGEKLSQTMWEGPETELTLTENAQPALMAVSMAVVAVLAGRGVLLPDHARFVAGHSLGEYSALAAVDSLSLADAARLLRLRGQAMQRAVPVGVGAMAAIMGLEFDQCAEIAASVAGDDVCAAANDNAPGQVVLSGHMSAVARAIEKAKEMGAKRAIELPVSAPFHCALMAPAAEEMAEALAQISLSAPKIPLIANVAAAPVTDAEEIRRLLVEQVTGRVRWRESMQWLAENGITDLVELGAGKVLGGLAKRNDARLQGLSLSSVEAVTAFLDSLDAS